MYHYFCGWYFKCQSNTQTVALIPALHKSRKQKSCSVQIITDENAWTVSFPCREFHRSKQNFHIHVGENYFGRNGIRLKLHAADCSAEGWIRFGTFSPIRYDIMGPFCLVPFMECRHSIISMRHTVTGELLLNGKPYLFRSGTGYIEGDRGYSFPKEYAWTQCSFTDGSLMLSAADIPLASFHFTGIIAVVLWKGREYRLATYLGAKVLKIKEGELVIRQGKMILRAKLIKKCAHPLLAPVSGAMSRTIHESASCLAYYDFSIDGRTLFSFTSQKASFEYEYPF